jgi:hypothetical protein
MEENDNLDNNKIIGIRKLRISLIPPPDELKDKFEELITIIKPKYFDWIRMRLEEIENQNKFDELLNQIHPMYFNWIRMRLDEVQNKNRFL